MARPYRSALGGLLLLTVFGAEANAQKPLTWEEVRELFRANNPSLQAGQTFIQEGRANEVTAGLRPNPQLDIVEDQFHVFNPNPLSPFQNSQLTHSVTQLLERRNKRPLRVRSAELATAISVTDSQDLERNLIFNLRDAFVRVLQFKSILQLAGDNLRYYTRVIDVNRERYKAGDISRSDLQRVELQRAQFDSDLVNAQVNLRTARIQLLALMDDKRPVDSFDVAGEFDFRETVLLPTELHQAALDARPDLRSAETIIRKAEADNKLAWANGSTDPTLGLEYQRTGPDNTMGFSFAIPLRIFDRNQGEKARTALEIRRSQQVRQALITSIFRDVDSAYAQVDSVRVLLRPYRDTYLKQAVEVRETVSFAYTRGGASLLDFLDAQKSYRDTELNYRNLIASYLSAANQLNLSVGREVLQ
jgi:cobalt-zinc-cadmium efflux system outer membrane protein